MESDTPRQASGPGQNRLRHLDLDSNARRVLEARYLHRDSQGKVLESPEELLLRVATGVAAAEGRFGQAHAVEQWTETFFELMRSRSFLPNSPTLMNAGTPMGQLCACFVLPVEDSLEDIFDSLKLMALVQQSGGGTGFSFSRLRPRGSPVVSSGGAASGPVSFMHIFDCATQHIRQGGRRRGANMGVLRVDHPDIREFIEAKSEGGCLENFNLSVGVTDAFMEAARDGREFTLIHPGGDAAGTLEAAEILDQMAGAAWRTGDPGLLFLDAINRANPTPALGSLEATNPCGEVPLLPYEACTLGSINLSQLMRSEPAGSAVDWGRLGEVARVAVRFLDDVIEVTRWPSPLIEAAARRSRKIGLGVMGLAEMLIRLGIPYGSPASEALAEEVMRFVASEARAASEELARERGVFPAWEGSLAAERGSRARHATLTSIAPTGTLSILGQTSPSIEPLFALAYRREGVLGNQVLPELNPLLQRAGILPDLHRPEVQQHLFRHGHLDGCSAVSPQARQILRTALEIPPEQHLRVQAAFQRQVDNAVSKTVNLPKSATPRDVRDIFLHAWELRLKGVTVYRYGSKGAQVLTLGLGESVEEREHFVRCDPQACRL